MEYLDWIKLDIYYPMSMIITTYANTALVGSKVRLAKLDRACGFLKLTKIKLWIVYMENVFEFLGFGTIKKI